MSAKQAQANAPPVSLFPFLAVLLCTMGALIVVLVAIAYQSRQVALRAAQAQQSQTRARWQRQLDQLQNRLDWLLAEIQAVEQDLEQDKQQRDQLAQRRKQLAEEVRRWQAQLAAAGEDTVEAKQLDQLRSRLVWYQHKLQELQTRLRQKPQQSKAVSYAIVPFQGHHGTRRRPIYIECRKDSVLIQPGEIELKARDFLHLGPENPLLAVLRTTVQYWRRQGLPPDETPYPLILVRPDGIAAYYAVRRALERWKGPLGYELIEADWQLEFGTEDPRLIQRQRLAVQQARRLQLQLARGDSDSRSSPGQGLYQADVFGGLRPVAPGSGHGEGTSPTLADTGPSSGKGGGFGTQAFRPTRTTTRPRRPGSGSHTAEVTGSGTAAAASTGGGKGPVFPGTGGSPGPSGPLLSGTPGGAVPGTTGPGSAGASQADFGSQTGGGSGPQRDFHSMLANSTGRGGQGPPGLEQGAGGAGQGNPALGNPSGSGSTGQQTPPLAGSAAAGGSGTASGGPGSSGSGSQGTGSPAFGLGTASAGGGGSSLGLSSSSGPGAATPGGSPGASSAASSAEGQPGTLGFSALLNQGAPPPAGHNAAGAKRRGSSAPALMEDPPPGAIPLRRAITANLYPDRLVVLHNGTLRTTTIPLNQPLGRWATQLTDVLAREIQSWGKAGRGMYWKPALRVRVAPGAQKNWQLLQQALRTSGLELRAIR